MEKLDSIRGNIFHPFVLSSITGFFLISIIFIFATHSHAQGEVAQKKPPLSPLAVAKPTPALTLTLTPTLTPTLSPTIPIPTPTKVQIPTAIPTPTPRPTVDPNQDSVWERLAQCESGGNWKEDTGNSYYGGLQFNQSAWESVGGAGKPSDASREDQIAKGKLLQARRGWSPWGGCSRQLGLD